MSFRDDELRNGDLEALAALMEAEPPEWLDELVRERVSDELRTRRSPPPPLLPVRVSAAERVLYAAGVLAYGANAVAVVARHALRTFLG